MASPSRKVLHLSGKDSPGTLTDFCDLVAREGGSVLHLSQSAVHGFLVVTAEIDARGSSEVAKSAAEFAQSRSLHLEVTELPLEAPDAKPCGIWVTILGDLSSPRAIATVGNVLRTEGLSITRVDSVGESPLWGVNVLAQRSNALTKNELNDVRGKLLALGPDLDVDLAVQRDDVFRASKRLLCMDVDSTFVKGEFIDELAEMAGKKEQVAAITARAMRGELDFEASLRERVKLLQGLEMSRARELCDRFELTPGAGDMVRAVKRLGMKVGLVSGGFDFFVEQLKDRFQLDFTFANELEVEGGVLTGNVIGTVVDSKRKAQVLKDMSHVFDIRIEQTIAAGDGANDIEMLQTAGLGIAYQAKPRLQEVADTRFNKNDRLDALLYLMGFDARKWVGLCRE